MLSVTVAWREQMLAAGGTQLKNRPDAAGANDQFAAMLARPIHE